jgi:DNA-binding NtrC family response regulator
LRVLETKRITRVGGHKEVEVDVRIVAATHQDLEAMCQASLFRQDLLYRLNAVTLEMPPLRARPEEILPLAQQFLAAACRANQREPLLLDADAVACLRAYPWPGNVRELKNAMERAAVIAQSMVVGLEDLPERLREDVGIAQEGDVQERGASVSSRVEEEGLGGRAEGEARDDKGVAEGVEAAAKDAEGGLAPQAIDLRAAVEDLETRIILAALARFGGHRGRAAERAGARRSHVTSFFRAESPAFRLPSGRGR